MQDYIYLSPPHMTEKERQFLNEAFDSNWIAPVGPFIDSFENGINKFVGAKSSCAVTSGTAALHLALRILGITKGHKVLCPSLTFSASANVILYENATPIFVDVDKTYWTISIPALEKAIKKYKPKAMISVDLYGQSCDYERINYLCEKYDVILIEDSAEALGSEYKGIKLGSFGEIGICSFNGNKIITTSGGGILISNNNNYTNKARFLSTQARENVLHYEHNELGYNYRMSNLLAAVGCAQLMNLDSFVKKRRKIFNRYYKELSIINGFNFMPEAEYCKSNRWLTTLTIDKSKTGFDHNKIIEKLNNENIESRPLWKPMHLQPYYKNCEYVTYDSDISTELFNAGLCLPSGSSLSESEQDRIIDILFSLKK